VGVALLFGATVLCGVVSGVLVPLALARLSHGGLAGLRNNPASLLLPRVWRGVKMNPKTVTEIERLRRQLRDTTATQQTTTNTEEMIAA
jgi:hypothetical protein